MHSLFFDSSTHQEDPKNTKPNKICHKNRCFKILRQFINSTDIESKIGFCEEVRLKHDLTDHPSYCESEDYEFLSNEMIISVNFTLRHYKELLLQITLLEDQ